jgi:hypothetical protein
VRSAAVRQGIADELENFALAGGQDVGGIDIHGRKGGGLKMFHCKCIQ